MIIHLFNSSSVSGPERLVLPGLSQQNGRFMVVNLLEERIHSLQRTDPLGEYSKSLGVPYTSVRVSKRWDRAAMEELRSLLEKMAPELVHAHDVKASIYLLQAKGRGGFPIVSTHHGVHGRPDLATRVYEFIYRRYFLNSFDRVLCVSSADHAFLLSHGVRGNILRLHLNGADERKITAQDRPKESSRIRALWFPHTPEREQLFLFGAIGRLSAEKGHARLLKTLSQLKHAGGREWRCLLFGSGPLEGELRRQAKALALEDRIVWMGYRQNAPKELAGLDILLSFSQAEGLPISLIEAGWAGTPVMATKVGGVKDLIPDETYGNLIEPEESTEESALRINMFLLKPGDEILQTQGRLFQERIADHFTRKKWSDRLEKIYLEIKVPVLRAEKPATLLQRDTVAVSR